jgi:choline kinase
MTYRVVIPTAGIGSRLGNLTQFINKSLISIAHRPALSHLIEQFPDDCEFVVALGYKGHLVREFIEIAYPKRTFYFAEVDPFFGQGSGLGYSLLCCERYLQQPFVFASCDTLVAEKIPSPDSNWAGYSLTYDPSSSYRSLNVHEDCVHRILEKGEECTGNAYAYIGLAGINSYIEFWSAMHHGASIAYDQGEAYGLRCLLESNQLEAHLFTWFDTGTPSTLALTRAEYSQLDAPNILEKPNEAIWFVGNRVIKFSDDESFVYNRVKRSSMLSDFCPQVLSSTPHMYSYEKVKGHVIAKEMTLPLFKKLLIHCQSFWKIAKLSDSDITSFQNKCKSFYYDKTLTRVEQFYHEFGKEDQSGFINGEPMPLLSSLLACIDWNNIAAGLPGRFHGDFHFENILWNSDSNSFTFLDWRQDFAGDLDVGDIYYDLAKLLHGLIVSHEVISANGFTIEWNDPHIRFDLYRKQTHVQCEKYLDIWCQNNGFEFSKVRALTALIFLNIAALHHYPYSLMLYALGKQMLHQQLNQQ